MASTRDNTVFGQCRCCLSDGYHRDIMKSYYKNGVREVYYDIFMDCFNLFLSTSPKLGTLVCVSCVKRLREAQEFKTMVVETERKLLSEIGDQDTLCVNVPEAPVLEIKAEPDVDIKFEPNEECNGTEADHNYEDEQVAVREVLVLEIKAEPDLDIKFEPNEECNGTEADHNYEDEPVTEPPIDEDLVEGEAELLRRFAPVRPLPTRQALYTISPNFARHLDLLRGKVIRSNMIEKLLEENGYQAKTGQTRSIYLSEKVGQVTNILLMLENSNLTPFKSRNRAGFPCFYCRHSFETLAKMKEHQKSHKKTELKKLLLTYGAECLVVYVDITDLKCTICDLSIPNLNDLKSHLIKTHKKKYRQEFTDRVIPFKLTDNNVYECQICGFTFETFGSVERHMNTHYRNYVCKDCGTGFVTKYRLKVHIKSMHVDGSFPCESCKKVFSSQQKLKNHVDTVHKLVKRFKCIKCPERFSEYFRRQKHMVTVHGVAPLQYKCNVCDKSFDRRYTLSRHMKRDHLEERDFQCELCSYKCFTNNELRVHMIKHNGERIFECAVCKKSYARKKTLKEHMRIHNNDRRFACAVCGQAFVQKCSLKGHIKTHHVDYAV